VFYDTAIGWVQQLREIDYSQDWLIQLNDAMQNKPLLLLLLLLLLFTPGSKDHQG